MFEKFNAEARQVFVVAQEEARQLAHAYIGTEHVLLGLIRDHESIAFQVLVTLGIDLAAVRRELISMIGRGTAETPDHIPFTPRAKEILELSLQEAAQLGHHYIGTEHILLGLLREGDGVAAQILNRFGIELEPARGRVVEMVGMGERPVPESTEETPSAPGIDSGPMFEKFTDRARRVVAFALEESRLLNHNYIGTEHLLLGLLAEHEGVAAKALGELGVTPDAARQEVGEIIGIGQQPATGHIPFTPRAKDALELSLREALQLGHNYISTEHLLLGLVAEGGGVALEVLRRLGADPNDAHQKVIQVLGNPKMGATRTWSSPPTWGLPLRRDVYDPALASLLFVAVALVAVVIEPPEFEVRLWGLSLLLGGVLLWAGGALIGSGETSGPRSRGMGRVLRVLGGLTLAVAASVFVLGALLA